MIKHTMDFSFSRHDRDVYESSMSIDSKPLNH